MPEAAPMPMWASASLATLIALQAFVWASVLRRTLAGEAVIPQRERKPIPWGADGAVLAGVFFVVGWLGVATAEPEAPMKPIDLADAAAFTAIAGLLATFAISWMRSNHCASWRDLGASESVAEVERDVVLGIVAMFAALLPVYLVQMLLVQFVGLPSSHPTIEQLLAEPKPAVVAAALVMAVIVTPLLEELAFRVLLQGWFERLGGPDAWWPIVASSAIFALAHAGQGWAPAPLFVLSLGLGYVYRQTHRFAPVVAMHLAFNLLSVVAAVATGLGQADEAPTGWNLPTLDSPAVEAPP